MKELGMDPHDYWWYLDLRRFGSCRHAGYGMGFERMVMYLTGINNIRDTLPHPAGESCKVKILPRHSRGSQLVKGGFLTD